MKVFLAGATGAIGKRLVPQLSAHGHHVVATTRSADKAARLRSLGAEPVLLDGFERARRWARRSLRAGTGRDRPRDDGARRTSSNLRHFDRGLRAHQPSCAREEPTTCSRAAEASGRRALRRAELHRLAERRARAARSRTEEDPLDPDPPAAQAQTLAAIRYLERCGRRRGRSRESCCATAASTAPAPRRLRSVAQRSASAGSRSSAAGAGVWSFDPRRRCGRGHRCRARARAGRHLQHRRRRSRAGLASGCPELARVPSAPRRSDAGASVARAARGRRCRQSR